MNLLELLKSESVLNMLGGLYEKYARPLLKELAEDDDPALDFNDHAYNIFDGLVSTFFKIKPEPLG